MNKYLKALIEDLRLDQAGFREELANLSVQMSFLQPI